MKTFSPIHTHIYIHHIFFLEGRGVQYKMYFLLWVIPKKV